MARPPVRAGPFCVEGVHGRKRSQSLTCKMENLPGGRNSLIARTLPGTTPVYSANTHKFDAAIGQRLNGLEACIQGEHKRPVAFSKCGNAREGGQIVEGRSSAMSHESARRTAIAPAAILMRTERAREGSTTQLR